MNRIDGTDRTHVIVMRCGGESISFNRTFTQYDARITSDRLNRQSNRTPNYKRKRFTWSTK